MKKREREKKNTIAFDKAKSFAVLPKEKKIKERKKNQKRVKTNIAVK